MSLRVIRILGMITSSSASQPVCIISLIRYDYSCLITSLVPKYMCEKSKFLRKEFVDLSLVAYQMAVKKINSVNTKFCLNFKKRLIYFYIFLQLLLKDFTIEPVSNLIGCCKYCSFTHLLVMMPSVLNAGEDVTFDQLMIYILPIANFTITISCNRFFANL